MRQTLIIALLSVLACTAPAAAAQDAPPPATAMDFEQARLLAGQDEARLDGDQLARYSQRQSDFLRPHIARCTRGVPTRELGPVGLVMELDAQGRVIRTWQDVHTPVADCLAAAVQGQVVHVPPKVPFLTATDLHWQR
jgi:hypothetical protein